MANLKLVCAIVLCVVVVAPLASEAVISCDTVNSDMAPCLTYLTNGGVVPPTCCDGVRALNNAANTTPDRQAACECLKSAASSAGNINEANAASLPGKCGVSIPYKISTSTNCNDVK